MAKGDELSGSGTEARPLIGAAQPPAQAQDPSNEHQDDGPARVGFPQTQTGYPSSYPLPPPGHPSPYPHSQFPGHTLAGAPPPFPGITVKGTPAPKAPLPPPRPFPKLPPPGTPVHYNAPMPRPAGTRVQIYVDEAGTVHAEIPSANPFSLKNIMFLVASMFWLGISGYSFFFMVAYGVIPLVIFFSPFVATGVPMFFLALRNMFLHEHVVVDQHRFDVERNLLGWMSCHTGSRADISHLDVKDTGCSENDKPCTAPTLVEGVNEHQFGVTLQAIEKQYVAAELSRLLQVPLGVSSGRMVPPAVMIRRIATV